MSEASSPHSISEWPAKPLTAHRVYQLVNGRQEDERSVIDLMTALRNLEEQYQALLKAAEYVRDGYDIAQADDAHFENAIENLREVLADLNPASEPRGMKDSGSPAEVIGTSGTSENLIRTSNQDMRDES